MKKRISKQTTRAPLQKDIKAVHTFTGTPLSEREHQKLINGPIEVASSKVETARKRIDRTRRYLWFPHIKRVIERHFLVTKKVFVATHKQ